MTQTDPFPTPRDVPPLNGEPLPLEFLNTVFPVRGELHDGFRSPEHLIWWLRSCRALFTTPIDDCSLAAVDEADVLGFTLLRDAGRRLVDSYMRCGEPEPWDVAQVNRAATMGRSLPMLHWTPGERPTVRHWCTATPVVAAQAEVAHALIELLAGSSGVEPTPCTAPGCVFFFDRGRSRRQWCSTGCGNRARAARHYARHHLAELHPTARRAE
ncbi:CGNR zinc finger domain-containing protein [Streptomyces sp. ALB3]|uniref:CGNR zinc finger domain-containing protein n=1 Tax=Streptomyces sp. ALB3 TaxID=3374278 RepID=UPI00378FE956